MPKVELELPELPEEYEYTGEYREPIQGESFMDSFGKVHTIRLYEALPPKLIIRKKRWRARDGDIYWTVSSCVGKKVNSYIEAGLCHDNHYWKMGNYFKTSEEALDARDKIVELLLSIHK